MIPDHGEQQQIEVSMAVGRTVQRAEWEPTAVKLTFTDGTILELTAMSPVGDYNADIECYFRSP